MTTPNTSNLEINQSPKVSVIDSAKSTKHRNIFNITESTESPSLKLSSKHIRMKRPSIFCVDSTNINFNKTNGFRRDVYGNFISKKKSQRISFIDDISDQKLTEVILIEAGEEKKKNITDKSTCECTVTYLLI